MKYLLDTSAWANIRHPSVRQRLAEIGPHQTYVCTPMILEAGVTARHPDEHDAIMDSLLQGGMGWYCSEDSAIDKRAVRWQRLLTVRGYHRAAKVSDLLIAAIAAQHDLTVLHYDSDFDLIAEVTGQPCEWVVPRGSVS